MKNESVNFWGEPHQTQQVKRVVRDEERARGDQLQALHVQEHGHAGCATEARRRDVAACSRLARPDSAHDKRSETMKAFLSAMKRSQPPALSPWAAPAARTSDSRELDALCRQFPAADVAIVNAVLREFGASAAAAKLAEMGFQCKLPSSSSLSSSSFGEALRGEERLIITVTFAIIASDSGSSVADTRFRQTSVDFCARSTARPGPPTRRRGRP
jgi:hypothetical protein